MGLGSNMITILCCILIGAADGISAFKPLLYVDAFLYALPQLDLGLGSYASGGVSLHMTSSSNKFSSGFCEFAHRVSILADLQFSLC